MFYDKEKFGLSLFSGLNRLLNINWNASDSFEHHTLLVGEYLCRVAIMEKKFALNLTTPFFKPSKLMAIDGHLSNIAMNKFLKLSSNIEKANQASVLISSKCFLLWNEGIDLGNQIATTYPDLYDPLICLIESGGTFGFHHGELLVGDSAFPLSNWKRFADLEIYLRMIKERTQKNQRVGWTDVKKSNKNL